MVGHCPEYTIKLAEHRPAGSVLGLPAAVLPLRLNAMAKDSTNRGGLSSPLRRCLALLGHREATERENEQVAVSLRFGTKTPAGVHRRVVSFSDEPHYLGYCIFSFILASTISTVMVRAGLENLNRAISGVSA